MPRPRRTSLGVALALTAAALVPCGPAAAQAPDGDAADDPILTELRIGRFFGFSGDDRSPFLLTAHVGYLGWGGEEDRWGGALVLGANDIDGFGGLELRWRRHLSDRVHVDAGAGLIALAGESLATPAPMANVGVSRDRFGLVLHVQTLQDLAPLTDEFREEETVVALSAQMDGELGARAALGVAAVMGFLWIALAAG